MPEEAPRLPKLRGSGKPRVPSLEGLEEGKDFYLEVYSVGAGGTFVVPRFLVVPLSEKAMRRFEGYG